MEIRLLGSLEVLASGTRVPLSGAKRKALLAALALRPGWVVAADELVELLWDGRPPPSASATVHSHVHHLRRQLGPAAPLIASEPPGYVLHAEADHVDVVRFERLAASGRAALAAGDPLRAAASLTEALALWRGPTLSDLIGFDFAIRAAARLDEARLGAIEDRLTADLALGRHQAAVGELEELTVAHPLRERLAELLVLALYRAGRQADALRAYQRTRRTLAEELGIEPGRALRDLEAAMLRQDAGLDLPRVAGGPAGDAGAVPADPASPPVGAPAGAAAAGQGVRPAGAAAPGPPAPAHGVPLALTTFVGRGAELRELRRLLRSSRLVTITGAGGSGKTRLATELCDVLARDEGAEIWFVDLAVVDDPSAVPGAVATTLGTGGSGTTVEALCETLLGPSLVMVLDNCEHVIEGVAPLAEQLLSRCAQLVILATSREELGVTGEVVWRVPSLSLPPRPPLEEPRDVLGAEAARLFLDRLPTPMDPTALGPADLTAVAVVCHHVDGNPLAIELAAGLASTMTLPEVADRLDDRLRVLGLRRRGFVARHTTLEATIAWSYELLDDDERDLFLRLSVFVGAFTADAAEEVAGSSERPGAVADVLSRLVQKSMVARVEGSSGAARYRLLEMLRHYAAASLPAQAAAVARRRHAASCLANAQRAEARFSSPDADRWLAAVEDDLPNHRAALQWSLEEGDLEVGLRLAGTLRWFFGRMGQLGEVRQRLERVLAQGHELPPHLLLLATTALGTVSFSQGDHRLAADLGEQGIELARSLGDERQLEVALLVRGASAVYEGRHDRAERCFVEAIELARRLGDRWGVAWILVLWGVADRRSSRAAVAEARLTESLTVFRALGDRNGEALPLVNLALLAQRRGDLEGAATLCDQAMAVGRTLGDLQVLHIAAAILGRVELDRGHDEAARHLLIRSLRNYLGAEHLLTVAIALEGLAVLTMAAGGAEDAAVLWGASGHLRERFSVPYSEQRAAERGQQLAEAAERLGPTRAEAALARGASLSLEEAVAHAVATASGPAAERPPPPSAGVDLHLTGATPAAGDAAAT